MHIPDGYLDPAVIAVTWAATIPFLIFAWKKTKTTYNQTTAATIAISSALVFVAQMINFPVAGGASSVHILGGTLLAVILGPYAAMLSMTTVLTMQAFFFADGGLLAFGANAFNMAVIGGLSFFIVQFLMRNSNGKSRFASSVFIASWSATVLTALLTGLELGFSITFAAAGGIALTVPTMFSVYAAAGLVEAVITAGLATALQQLQPGTVLGLKLLGGREKL
jgi:cobalt/nickel transport system permease protein